MKDGRKPEYPEKTPGDELQKMPHTTARRFKPQARLEPAQWHWWQARKADMQTVTPRVALFQLCFSVSPPTVARSASLPLPLRVPVIPVPLKLTLQWLPCKGSRRYKISAGTGWPGVGILRLGEIESLICNLYRSVAACTLV